MNFFEELKRRNVFRVGIAYVLMGWVLLQGADFVLDVIAAPDWTIRALILVVALGLPIALFFAWAFEVTPEGIKREADVDRSASVAPHTGRKLDRAIMVFLAVAVVLLLADRFFVSGDRKATSTSTETAATIENADETETPDKSVAVLPFADLSQNGDQEWFADGLAEEILNALARTPDLLVASRTSSFSYKGSNKDMLEIAREMGVAHVLEGSVRSSGDRIRVTAQLIRAEDGFHIWSENYDRSPEDMIAIQEDLAQNIAEALETTMDPDALEAMAQVGTRSVEAYKSYLQGVAAEAVQNVEGTPKLLEAIEQFVAATNADPRFSQAYLRQALWWKGQLTPSYRLSGATDLTVEALMERFTEAIDAAIEHAASDIDRKGLLAQKAEVEVRLRDATDLYEEYLDTRPNDTSALLSLASVAEMAGDQSAIDQTFEAVKSLGQRDQGAAIFYMSLAYDRDDPQGVADYAKERAQQWPNSPGVLYQVHRALMWAGEIEEGASLQRQFNRQFDPSPLMEMRQACIEGRRDDAETAFAAISRGEGDQWRTSAWLGLKMLGRDDEASRMLQPISESSSPYQLASTLNYAIFDPRPYPELMNILDREGVLRAPARELPFKCPPPDETSIAVLPFANMSSDPEQEFFSDGITEEILNALAQVPDLKVAGRTSSFAFKGRNEDLRAIGEALGVNHILEGSVRKAGNQVRITAQLIKADDGFHLWSETFDRELTDIFAIQDEIAAAILEQLETQLAVGSSIDVAEVDLAVYDQYLKARQLMRGRAEQDLQQASDLLDQVIAQDADYAPALAQRAIVELMLSDRFGHYGSIPFLEALDNAEGYAQRSLALDPNDPDALAVQGSILQDRGELADGIALLERALELSPNHTNAMNWLAGAYGDSGRFREQFELRKQLFQVDPLYPPGVGNLMGEYLQRGELQEMQQLLDSVIPYLSGPSLNYVKAASAFGSMMQGREAEAIRQIDALPPGERGWGEVAGAMGYARLKEYERALPYVEGQPLTVSILGRLGRTEEALQLGQALLAGGQGLGNTIGVLHEAGRHEEIISLVESRFDTPEDFIQQSGEGVPEVVYAYRVIGQDSKAARTLALYRGELEHELDEGRNNAFLSQALAHLAMLEGDPEQALDYLERAMDQGGIDDFARYSAIFQPLLGDPRYESLMIRVNDHRNEQRALLDLPPIEFET